MEFDRGLYVAKLASRRENGLVKVITGARRSGKSYLLNELFYRYLVEQGVPEKQIIRFAFDADEDLDLLDGTAGGEPVKIHDEKMGYRVNSKVFRQYVKSVTNETDSFVLMLDEVQYLDNFVGTLNSYLRHKNFDIYVTGSNSRFLSTDIATEFKGRSSEIHVYPLTFGEYVRGLSLKPEEAWKEYIVTGGMPVVALMNQEDEKITYLKNLCNETYLKDIIQRNGIRKKAELSDTFDMLASMIGSAVNPTKLANTFQSMKHNDITDDTMNRFVTYFEEAFVLSKARKYNIKGRKYIDSPYKVYFEDIGVRNARLDFRQTEETHIMENVIYNELKARGFSVSVGEVDIREATGRVDKNGHDIYSAKSLEVDFIAVLGSRKYYVQSALSMRDPDKAVQEKKSLYYIDDSFKKIIVTRNGLKESRDEKGILTIDLFDFLCDENSLDI